MPESRRFSPVWLVLGSILSVQLGAAIAKHLFGVVPPTAMVWLRLASSALILLALARPRLRGHSGRDWTVGLAFGLALVGMNWLIYQGFARIPLGIAVTIEFLGPLAVAVGGSRRVRDLLWAGLAALGVVLLGFTPTHLNWFGVVLSAAAGTCWAGYILLAPRLGKRWDGLSGLTVASVAGAVVLAAPAVVVGGSALWHPGVLAIGAAVGLLSSVIPYSLELVALRTIPPRIFGILMSLEPAAAALMALLVLHERLSLTDLAAMACVVTASIGATRSSPSPAPAPAPAADGG